MSSLHLLALLSSAALLATAGCSMEEMDRADGLLPSAIAATVSEPSGGQEIHMMFEAEKRKASQASLPDQF